MPDKPAEKSIGSILKEARAAKNLSLEQASRGTKIHINILKNIEADQFASLGPVYIKSFLKIYAEYLGLNKEDVVGRFEGPSGSASRKFKLPAAEASNFFDKIDMRFLVFFVLALVLIWGGVKFFQHRKAAVKLEKKAPVERVTLVKEPEPVKPAQAKNALKAAASKTVKTASSAPARQQEKIVLTVKAKSKSWVQVKVDGKVFFRGALARGSAETWQAQEKIELWLGDAGAVQFELNGKVLERVGRPGQTLKRVLVTRSGLSIQR